MMTHTPPHTPDTTPPTTPPALSNEPARLAAYLKDHRTGDTPLDFADFIRDLKKSDFDDIFEIRDIFENQAHLLGAMFQYLMMEGDWRNLPMALRAQKMMLETLTAINGYPSRASVEVRRSELNLPPSDTQDYSRTNLFSDKAQATKPSEPR